MHKKDIIVIGASAGGISALIDLVKSIPAGYQGSVFIVLHLSATTHSYLAEILGKECSLPVVQPNDGDNIESGKIYVPTPDHHLLVENGKILVKRGPKENRFRPSIDALFRSAAYEYGVRVVGIVLSGVLDDGTSGMWSINRMGGTCIVQDPEEAKHPEMPLNAAQYTKIDHRMKVAEMGPLLAQFYQKEVPARRPALDVLKLLEVEVTISKTDNAFEMEIMKLGKVSPFTCPECHGALIQIKHNNLLRYRCQTGHAFSARTLLAGISEVVEDSLWHSMRALEESAMLLTDMANRFKELGQVDAAKKYMAKSKHSAKQAKLIQSAVNEQQHLNEDIRHKGKVP